MLKDVSVTKQLVYQAMAVLGSSVDTGPNGLLSCSGLPLEVFGASSRRIGFVDTYPSLDEVPADVEIVIPGSPIFEAIAVLAAKAPRFAIASRPNSHLEHSFTSHKAKWIDCVVLSAQDVEIRRAWLLEHYFRVRFFTFEVDERVVRVVTDQDAQHVAIDECDLSRLAACQCAVAISSLDPLDPSRVEGSLNLAHESVLRWATVERCQAIEKLSGRWRQSEASLQQFYKKRHQEREEAESTARRNLPSAKDRVEATERLEAMIERHMEECQEDLDDMAAQLSALKQRYGVCETRLEHLATMAVDAHCASQSLILQRGNVSVRANLFTDCETAGVPCQSCLHVRADLSICDGGHIACQPCLSPCGRCSRIFCQACRSVTCSLCQTTACQVCSQQCSCGRLVCRDHIRTCAEHGEYCDGCGTRCASPECAGSACPACVNEGLVCARCHKPKCEDCRHLHIDCNTLTCHACSKKATACEVCGLGRVSCLKCDSPKKRCSTCKAKLCHKCVANGEPCGEATCDSIICARHSKKVLPTCVDCNCLLCPKCAKRSRCRSCTDQMYRSERLERLAKLPKGPLLSSFASVLKSSGLGDLESKLRNVDSAGQDSYIDVTLWQDAIHGLDRAHKPMRYNLARFIEKLGPLHLLDTKELERVLSLKR